MGAHNPQDRAQKQKAAGQSCTITSIVAQKETSMVLEVHTVHYENEEKSVRQIWNKWVCTHGSMGSMQLQLIRSNSERGLCDNGVGSQKTRNSATGLYVQFLSVEG
jgi:hypothetical protein